MITPTSGSVAAFIMSYEPHGARPEPRHSLSSQDRMNIIDFFFRFLRVIPIFGYCGSGEGAVETCGAGVQPERTQAMKRLTVVCIGALLTLSAAPNAFGWGAVTGPRGGAAYRGPMGGAAVRGPYGGAAVRGPYGGAAARGPYGGTAVRGPVYGGGAVYRGPVYGGTVYRPGVGYGVAAGVAVGAAAGAAAASTYCYSPPYCYPPPYYQPPAW